MYAVSVACSCSQSKRGKKKHGLELLQQERKDGIVPVCSCLPGSSGSWSMAFPSGTALFLCFGWLQFQAWTSLCRDAGAAPGTWKPPGPAQSSTLCQEFPLAACGDSWARVEWALGRLSRRGKNKHGKHLCAPKICLQLDHKMLI